jgi:hypothetical protein
MHLRRNSRGPVHGKDSSRHDSAHFRWLVLGLACAILLAANEICWGHVRTPLKPGCNLFTPEQDIQIGQPASARVGRRVLLLNDSRVDNYLDVLGQELAAQAPGYKYPYQYRCVSDENINAFAPATTRRKRTCWARRFCTIRDTIPAAWRNSSRKSNRVQRQTAGTFFSDHANAGHRTERVDEEVEKLGGPEPNYLTDSDDFRSIKIYVMKLPKPPKTAGK